MKRSKKKREREKDREKIIYKYTCNIPNELKERYRLFSSAYLVYMYMISHLIINFKWNFLCNSSFIKAKQQQQRQEILNDRKILVKQY